MPLKKKLQRKILLPAHYDSIDFLPILFWAKLHEKGDMVWLLEKKKRISNDQKKELKKVFEKIYEEYINVFGFGENFTDVLELQIKIAKLKLKKVTTDDLSIDNFIRANEIKMEAIKKRNIGGDIYKTKEAIEKKIGIRIPMAECSVREFYSYLKSVKK